MIETSGEGGSAWLTPPLGGINSSLKEREREITDKDQLLFILVWVVLCSGSAAVYCESVHNIITNILTTSEYRLIFGGI